MFWLVEMGGLIVQIFHKTVDSLAQQCNYFCINTKPVLHEIMHLFEINNFLQEISHDNEI